jgi:hypothetical protein
MLWGKRDSLRVARPRCGAVWLVIVNDVFSRAAPVELSEPAQRASYDHEFDRLLWLEPHALRVRDLLRRL